MSSNDARDKASDTLKAYGRELEDLDENLARLIQESKDIAPNGRNIKEADYEMLQSRLLHQQNQVAATQQQLQLDALRPQQSSPAALARAQQIAALQEKRTIPAKKLRKAITASRDPSDAAITHARLEVSEIDDQTQPAPARLGPERQLGLEDAAQQILSKAVENVNDTQDRINALMEEMRGSMPNYQKYTTMMADREHQGQGGRRPPREARRLPDRERRPEEAGRDHRHGRHADHPRPAEPGDLHRRLILFSLGAGVGLVCLLEHIDHSVKVPEHLTAGLALPLFGVVPRMIRSSRNHRGGHLWTSGTPDSIEADAYRNLRASLLGAIDGKGPIVTLLITSAKAGEGKSTTALNLAATCARAGERTLLMDVDLRRPSLNGVFPGQDHDHGLVDVLRGDLPWQRTVVQTDLPNLDFLPTGDTRDVPIEVLGSLELRQLLLSLSQNHYDRVILDGPAVLGLADCRMLGRIVDAAVMVVRSGSQEIRSLQRAKAMLEQSQVFIAGLVFNGLCDDLENWSSYGPNPFMDSPVQLARSPLGGPRGLDGRGGVATGAGALMTVAPRPTSDPHLPPRSIEPTGTTS